MRGVVGKKPIHLLRDDDRKKVPEMRELHIDIGARDGEQAREMVRIGDVAVIDAQPVALPNGRLVSRASTTGSAPTSRARGRAPGRAGRAARSGSSPPTSPAAQEETTFGGSRTSAFSLEPDAAIVLDVTHATDAPGIDVKASGKHPLGSGATIGRGSTLHEGLFELPARRPRAAHDIPFTVEANARVTGTDADAVHATGTGVPTAVVSIPVRYMHSPVEVVELSDVADAARLIAQARRSP